MKLFLRLVGLAQMGQDSKAGGGNWVSAKRDRSQTRRTIHCLILRSRWKWQAEAIVVEMEQVLSLISGKQWKLTEPLLLKSLDEWG